MQSLLIKSGAIALFSTAFAVFLQIPTLANESRLLSQSREPGANPNRDRLLQPDTVPEPEPLPEDAPPILPLPERELEAVPQPQAPSEALIQIERIEVIGSSVYDVDDWTPITQPLEGRAVGLTELRAAADAISGLYLQDGYLNGRAVLNAQTIEDGVVRIQIIEGRISDIQISGSDRLNDSYVRQRVERGIAVPLRTDRLEEQLRLLQSNPQLQNIEASLRASETFGDSILVLNVTEAEPFTMQFSLDNYSPTTLGSERAGLLLSYNNLTGNGDRLYTNVQRSTRGGSEIYEFGYTIPVNPQDGTLQLKTVLDRNEIVRAPFNALDINGESELYEISFRQPILKTLRNEVALSFGFSHRNGQSFLGNEGFGFGIGPEEDGVSRTSVIRLGQDFVSRDTQGAWSLRSQFNIGVDLFDITKNEGSIPDGGFFSWSGQAQRVQQLGDNHLLIVQFEAQLSPSSLLSSEQFVIGGGRSVRGYRQNARSGDNGVRFSIEDRIALIRNPSGQPTFQLAPFLDMGAVWNVTDNPNNETRPDNDFLIGVGLGVLWEVTPGLNIRLDYAPPLIDLGDQGNNVQDDGLYFSASISI